MKIEIIKYKCDICGKEVDEETANSSFTSASYTTIKNDWDGDYYPERSRYDDVCFDCLRKIDDSIQKIIKEIKGGIYYGK